MLITHKEHANELLTFLKETSAPFPTKMPAQESVVREPMG